MIRPRGVGEVDGGGGHSGQIGGRCEAHVIGDGNWGVEVDGLQLEVVPVLCQLGRGGGTGVEEGGVGQIHQNWRREVVNLPTSFSIGLFLFDVVAAFRQLGVSVLFEGGSWRWTQPAPPSWVPCSILAELVEGGVLRGDDAPMCLLAPLVRLPTV